MLRVVIYSERRGAASGRLALLALLARVTSLPSVRSAAGPVRA
jgi:hypothetical protein